MTPDIQELKRLAEAALRRPLNAYHEASIEAVNFYRAASPDTILALIEVAEAAEEAADLIEGIRVAKSTADMLDTFASFVKPDDIPPGQGGILKAATERAEWLRKAQDRLRTALEGVKK